jgi:hypothetical protein
MRLNLIEKFKAGIPLHCRIILNSVSAASKKVLLREVELIIFACGFHLCFV